MSVAEDVAEYVLSRVRRTAPRTWRQAPRSPPLREAPERSSLRESSLREFAEHRIFGVSELAVRGLFFIDEGFPVRVSEAPFSAEDVLVLQACGLRCVSLLPVGERAPEPHRDGLEFVLHDLCHVAKFADPRHHDEQVGFFRSVERASAREAWRAAERDLDAQWHADRLHVSADMNGSSVFLFVCLKAKLRLAASRIEKRAPAFEELFERWLDSMDLTGAVRDAAREISGRSDAPAAAEILADHFRDRGRAPAVSRFPGASRCAGRSGPRRRAGE